METKQERLGAPPAADYPHPPQKNKGRPRNFAFKISQQKKDEFARGDNLGFTKEGGVCFRGMTRMSATPPFGSKKP